MKLNEYLQKSGTRAADFAQELGVKETTVNRYRSGERIPEKAVMKRIKEVTHGLVTADSFYTE